MSDPWDRIQEHESGLRYDSFYVAPPGTFSRPDMKWPDRTAIPDLFERAREPFSWGNNHKFEALVSKFSRLMRF